MSSKSELCKGHLDAVLSMQEANNKLKKEHDLKMEEYYAAKAQYDKDLVAWEKLKDVLIRTPSPAGSGGHYVVVNGKGIDCRTLPFDNIKCCRDASEAAKKCTLQAKGGNVKCGNNCTFLRDARSCYKPGCVDYNPAYGQPGLADSPLPGTHSAWHNRKTPQPQPPVMPPPIVYQPQPTLICQDCSSQMSLLDNVDTDISTLSQVNQCINNLEARERESGGNYSKLNDNTSTLTPPPTLPQQQQPSLVNGNGNGNGLEPKTDATTTSGFMAMFMTENDDGEEEINWMLVIITGIVSFIILMSFIIGINAMTGGGGGGGEIEWDRPTSRRARSW
jgi:hypothetical protein